MNGYTIDEKKAENNDHGFQFDQNQDVFDGPQSTAFPVDQVNSVVNGNIGTPIATDERVLNPSESHRSIARPGDQSFHADVEPQSRDTCQGHSVNTDRPNLLKRLESIRAWGRNTIKCTKQVIEEKLGTSSPTCDENLDLRIESLRHMQKQYKTLLDLVKQFSVGFTKTIQSQRQVAGQLAHLGQQQIELTGEFAYNAETQRMAVFRGEKLLAALDAFCDGLNTLIHHTFEDTFLTIKQMHTARVEYDAYRKEAEVVRTSPRKSTQPSSPQSRRAEEAISRFVACENNLNRLKSAVDAKLRLLHENRARVMQHNLLLLHNSTMAYYAGDEEHLDAVLKQFNVRVKSPLPSNSPVNPPCFPPSQPFANSLPQPLHGPSVDVSLDRTGDSVSVNGFAPVAKIG
ncbi:ADP-ribosylation factor-interacting protein 1 [Fasciola gigantica]|uniref:ADP-ribosylation factor-interacting protein 1 n=1 Tax=Fasciola gigantica TaxID=46835 RepID=A0A504YG61_FASGI|nr:ADP-ribosylation factor-interacting protein 1 [Fasciola gigantica]